MALAGMGFPSLFVWFMGRGGFRRLLLNKPSPWGKVAPKGPDEGAGFKSGSFYVGGFRRLRAASDFPSDGKVTKGSPGDVLLIGGSGITGAQS